MNSTERDTGRSAGVLKRAGWRGYVLPLLAVVAIVATVVAVQSPSADSGSQAATSSAEPATEAIESQASPTQPAVDPAAPTPGYVQAGDGSMSVVPGSSAVLGAAGPVTTFDVLIEGGVAVDGAQFAAYVEQILADPRGWTATGQRSFQRTADGSAAMHIMLVSPQHVESLCPGYGTEGYTSCRFEDRVVINLARWSIGVPDYTGYLWDYRQYVINHEVGHFLGAEHVECPAPGATAPVMMQQTLGLQGCLMNPWPYPNSPAEDPNAPA